MVKEYNLDSSFHALAEASTPDEVFSKAMSFQYIPLVRIPFHYLRVTKWCQCQTPGILYAPPNALPQVSCSTKQLEPA